MWESDKQDKYIDMMQRFLFQSQFFLNSKCQPTYFATYLHTFLIPGDFWGTPQYANLYVVSCVLRTKTQPEKYYHIWCFSQFSKWM